MPKFVVNTVYADGLALFDTRLAAGTDGQVWVPYIYLYNIYIYIGSAYKGFEPLWCWNWNIPGELGQFHGCWCLRFLRHQVISSQGIDCVGQTCWCFPVGNTINVKKYYKNAKMFFMFTKINLGQQRSNIMHSNLFIPAICWFSCSFLCIFLYSSEWEKCICCY